MAFTAEGGVEPKGDRYDRSYLVKSDNKLYKRTELGDFIYSSNNLDVGSMGLNKYGTAVISDVYEIFSIKDTAAPSFIDELIHCPNVLHKILQFRQGCLYGQYRIYADDFLSVSVLTPSKAEQQRISDFFATLDKKIMLQRKLIEYLKKYKRGVMSSYFNGKLVLKHPIGQHYSHWQEFTLSDVSDEFKSGKSITSNEINEVGEYAVYGGNGVRGYTDHYSHEGQYIVVGRQGALCGNVRIIDGKNYLSEHAIAVKANSNHYTPFLLYLLTDMRLGQYSDQGAQPGLAVNKLLKLKRRFPEYDEQVRFATFMQQIDHKLSSEENKLEYITTLKRGLLQQLFI